MSGQLLSAKVGIVEEEPRVRGITSAPTSVAGAVGVTERGPIGEAVVATAVGIANIGKNYLVVIDNTSAGTRGNNTKDIKDKHGLAYYIID